MGRTVAPERECECPGGPFEDDFWHQPGVVYQWLEDPTALKTGAHTRAYIGSTLRCLEARRKEHNTAWLKRRAARTGQAGAWSLLAAPANPDQLQAIESLHISSSRHQLLNLMLSDRNPDGYKKCVRCKKLRRRAQFPREGERSATCRRCWKVGYYDNGREWAPTRLAPPPSLESNPLL